jgi:hypothetical protein
VNGQRPPRSNKSNASRTLLEDVAELEACVHARLNSRIRNFRLEFCDNPLILQGQAHTYYAKQLAQHAVMELTWLPIKANEIEVF